MVRVSRSSKGGNMKKGSAFFLIHITLFVLALGAFWAGVYIELWPGLVAGMVTNGAAFITGNVADNGIKGHFYNSELDRG